MTRLRRIGSRATLILGALMVALAAPSTHAADRQTRDIVRDANRALADGDYQAALDGYREAEAAEPESTELNYNSGLAHYKLQEFTEARRLFNEALATRDSSLEARAKFNLGNCAYSEALEKVDAVPEAVDLLREATGFYRHSLELNPQDDDARVNIEMAQQLIKELQDQQQQEQEQEQQQQSDEQQQDQQEQQQQDGENEPQENEQQNPDDSGQEEQPREPQSQDGAQEEQQDQQQPSEEQDEPQEMEMTPEQAERLLQAVRDKEHQRRDERARRMRAGRRSVLRDW